MKYKIKTMSKMMKQVFKIWMIMLPLIAFGKEPDDEVSKKIEYQFALEKGGNLEIINKYGQVVVSPWDKDSVMISVSITAFGKSRSEARKTLERVDVDFDNTHLFLKAETVFDRNGSFFTEVWKSFTDEATALLSKSKIEINYEVFLPQGISLTLDNKYGDVFLNELDGRLNLTLMHGNLRANDLNANASIDISFGDVRIKYMHSGKITLKASDGDIIKMGNVFISSSSSDLTVREGDRIRIDSRSDKRLRFDKITSLSGKALFSNIMVGQLTTSAELEMSYGDINFRTVDFNFSTVDLVARSTDVEIGLSNKSFITVDIEGKEEDMHLPIFYERLEKREIDVKKNIVNIKGKIGEKNNYPAILSITSSGGDIIIHQLDEEDKSANNN